MIIQQYVIHKSLKPCVVRFYSSIQSIYKAESRVSVNSGIQTNKMAINRVEEACIQVYERNHGILQ